MKVPKSLQNWFLIHLIVDLLFGLRTEEEITSDFEEDKQQYKTSVKHADSIKNAHS